MFVSVYNWEAQDSYFKFTGKNNKMQIIF